MKKKQNLGFTMIELLVGPQFFGKVDSSKVRAAETQVKMLKMALQTYRLDVGTYPSTLEGLREKPPGTNSQWQGPYLDDVIPKDPWNNDYQYSLDKSSSTGFYLFSFGADGEKGGDETDAEIGYVPVS
jgi:general secretion pathway protein G